MSETEHRIVFNRGQLFILLFLAVDHFSIICSFLLSFFLHQLLSLLLSHTADTLGTLLRSPFSIHQFHLDSQRWLSSACSTFILVYLTDATTLLFLLLNPPAHTLWPLQCPIHSFIDY